LGGTAPKRHPAAHLFQVALGETRHTWKFVHQISAELGQKALSPCRVALAGQDVCTQTPIKLEHSGIDDHGRLELHLPVTAFDIGQPLAVIGVRGL
jgi:hypothetical protein